MRANATTSAVSPEFDNASTTSRSVTIPASPCNASAACTKYETVPVLANVAANFAPTKPDLPSPVTTSVPPRVSTRSAAARNASALRVVNAPIASAVSASASSPALTPSSKSIKR